MGEVSRDRGYLPTLRRFALAPVDLSFALESSSTKAAYQNGLALNWYAFSRQSPEVLNGHALRCQGDRTGMTRISNQSLAQRAALTLKLAKSFNDLCALTLCRNFCRHGSGDLKDANLGGDNSLRRMPQARTLTRKRRQR